MSIERTNYVYAIYIMQCCIPDAYPIQYYETQYKGHPQCMLSILPL